MSRFIAGWPCLEEVEGYLLGLRIQHDLGMDAPPIDADIIGPLEQYKALLMSGKEVPRESRLPREWEYRKGRKPARKRRPPVASTTGQMKVLDRNKERKK